MPRTEVDLTGLSDDEIDDDEALRQAIALSLQDQEKPNDEEVVAGKEEEPEPEVEVKAATFGSMMLDRKAMEEERLKRLAAKRARLSDEAEVDLPPSKKLFTSRAAEKAPEIPSRSKPSGVTLQFPRGVVKKTWVKGYPREGDDIKIEEVLQKDQLELAILSSYQWDDEWLTSKIDLRRTKTLLVAYAADEAQKRDMQENAPHNIKFSFPPMNGPGAMHSKLQVLKFSSHVRIVVPTGNLVPYDWGETGVMENMVFLIDVPRLADAAEHQPTAFSSKLSRFLLACQVDEKLVHSLTNYDFSQTAQLGFVHTIAGVHRDERWRRTGYCGLGDTVSSLGLAATGLIEVDFVCSSLGSINIKLVEVMYNACQGDDGMMEFEARLGPRATRKAAPRLAQEIRDRFRIVFPTDKTVASTRGGRGAAGTICAQAKWWRSISSPTNLVRDCVSKPRQGVLMHSKIIFVRPTDKYDEEYEDDEMNKDDGSRSQSKAWAYVGSANLSESAWGRLTKDSETGKPKLTCRNWECGVVVPVGGLESPKTTTSHRDKTTPATITTAATTTPTSRTTAATGKVSDLDAVFASTVPVPMVFPARPYGPNEEPWFYAEPR